MQRSIKNDWFSGLIPENIVVETGAHIETTQSFELFLSQRNDAVVLKKFSSVYPPTMFDLGPRGRVNVGEYAMLNGPRIICDSEIEIGAYSLIAWNVVLMDCYRAPKDSRPCPIRIGTNVWIGFDAIVLPGVTIGEGAIVGARSVVREDVAPYSIVAGNPARKVGQCTQR